MNVWTLVVQLYEWPDSCSVMLWVSWLSLWKCTRVLTQLLDIFECPDSDVGTLCVARFRWYVLSHLIEIYECSESGVTLEFTKSSDATVRTSSLGEFWSPLIHVVTFLKALIQMIQLEQDTLQHLIISMDARICSKHQNEGRICRILSVNRSGFLRDYITVELTK